MVILMYLEDKILMFIGAILWIAVVVLFVITNIISIPVGAILISIILMIVYIIKTMQFDRYLKDILSNIEKIAENTEKNKN